MKFQTVFSILILGIFILSGCANPAAVSPTAQAVTLKVFAPSSLTEAANELAANFEAGHPGVKVAIEFGHSPTQRLQFTEGAKGDVFITAAQKDMTDAIADKSVAADAAKVFASNKLVIILSPKNTANLEKFEDLSNAGVKLLLGNADIPVGMMTMQALDKMDKQLGAGFKEKVIANVVSNEAGVKPIVSKTKLAEADAGIVYVSDTISAPELKILAIPDEMNMVSKLNIAPLANSEHAELAAAFRDYVISTEGQAVLKKWGFLPAK